MGAFLVSSKKTTENLFPISFFAQFFHWLVQLVCNLCTVYVSVCDLSPCAFDTAASMIFIIPQLTYAP